VDLFVCKILGWLSLNKSKEKFCDTKQLVTVLGGVYMA